MAYPESEKSAARLWSASVLVFGVSFAHLVLTTGFTNDQFVAMAKGQQVLLGELHVRDFVDEGQPLPILLAAGIQVAGGHSMFGETVFDASLIALGIAVAFVVLRLSQAPVLLTWILPVAAVVLQPRLYNYPKLFLYPVALLFCFALLRRPSRRRVLAFGLFIGVAFLFRHDHGAYIGTVGLLATVLATVRQSRAVVLTRALQLAGCIAIPMLPYLAFVATYGNLVEYFQDGLHFARAEADRTGLNRLPRFAVDASRGPLEFAELPPPPLARVNVRWTDAVDDARRPRVERQLGLANPRHLGDTVYQYDLLSSSLEEVQRIVRHRFVADTGRIDRSTFIVERVSEPSAVELQRRFPVLRVRPLPGLLNRANAAV